MTNDGTQDPGPPPILADPLSGLVTGSQSEPEPLKVRVVEPPMPDINAVRRAMVDMLDEDSELDLSLVPETPAPDAGTQAAGIPAPSPPGDSAPAAAPPADAPPADAPATPPIGVPAQQAAPVAPATPLAVPVPRRPAGARQIPSTTIETPRLLPRYWPRMRGRSRPARPAAAMGRKSSAPSIAAIAVLLLVIAVLVIVFFASLIDTIASIFS